MTENSLKIALVGFGHIGKLHKKVISLNKNLTLVAIVDIDGNEEDFPLFKDIEQCHLQFPDVDLYVIATPNSLHYEQAKKILELNKNVLVEKPVSLHKEQVESLVSLAEKNQVRIFSSLQLRFNPYVQYIKRLLNTTSLGEIYMVHVECFWNRNQEYYENSTWHGSKNIDGGVLFTQFSHFIDIIHYLFGNLKLTSGISNNYAHKNSTEFPDSGILQFKTQSALGSMIYTISTFEKNFDSSITLIAEKGTIKIGGQYMDQLLFHNVEALEKPEIHIKDNLYHKNLYQNILISLKEKLPSIVDAENSIDVIDFIEKSSAY
ncbi:Gfo/Idh/MocA family protein [Apibacter sp. HY039]|uniref:Gfo/Idh/MocA family protein n=1 Tax=Apibacter sp. HY039 TaxID=2501476 RepID=UPI000FEBB2D3|nr:Gfo/Idh/MocA family oxidoreductase [Apibacter sp. HY039]